MPLLHNGTMHDSVLTSTVSKLGNLLPIPTHPRIGCAQSREEDTRGRSDARGASGHKQKLRMGFVTEVMPPELDVVETEAEFNANYKYAMRD